VPDEVALQLQVLLLLLLCLAGSNFSSGHCGACAHEPACLSAHLLEATQMLYCTTALQAAGASVAKHRTKQPHMQLP
jgi:hypothetical protein